jgi:putative ABC transport system permease protein
MSQLPPKAFLSFFRWYCKPVLLDHIEGDLIEEYQQRLRKMSRRKANLKFIIDVLLLFRPSIIRPLIVFENINRSGMYNNYLKITFRVFNRERLYSLINVSGLAFGFACCLIIYLFISDELSYDKFHHDGQRIYRISAAYMRQGQWEPYASNSWRTAELVKNNYSEVEELVRIMPDNNTLFEYSDKRILENSFAWVDDNFFKLFNFPLAQGNPTDALKGPNKVVISESMAAKYFNQENPIGKVFKLPDYETLELQVSGVMKDMPSNSHFHFDCLISAETVRQIYPENLFTNVGWDSQFVYVRLARGANPVRIEASFPEFINKNLDFWKSTTFKMFLQPLESIHLESNIGRELETNGSMVRVYTFSIVAIFILVIACVNYMNLTTARSLRRAKEVGMRKVLGAKKPDLLGQFLVESLIVTAVAILLGVILAFVLLPEFNRFAGKEISRVVLISPRVIVGLVLSLIAVGLVSGLYPAVILSSFRPLNSMKGSDKSGKGGLVLRKGLVLLQFVISIGLIAASVIVFKQWSFMKNKALGISDEMLVAVPLQTMDRQKISSFTNELLADRSIKKIGFSNMQMPGWIGNSTNYLAQDVKTDEEVNKSMKIVRIDYDFLPTIEADLVDGRNFSRDFPADTISSIILNESAVAQLGWKDAIGKWMEFRQIRYTVIGVVKDFHFESLHRKIPPTIFVYSPRALNWVYLKIDALNPQVALEHVEKIYGQFVTNRDFTFSFVNEDMDRQYEAEKKFTQVFTLFTGLAIIIACLGTFGLISFTAERKSKEIGIRKVLGASIGSVSFLLIKEFVVLLLIASAIAWPATFYFLQGWINEFVYRASIGVMPFVAATFLAGIIVVITTGFRALKAALANPIDSLRDE